MGPVVPPPPHSPRTGPMPQRRHHPPAPARRLAPAAVHRGWAPGIPNSRGGTSHTGEGTTTSRSRPPDHPRCTPGHPRRASGQPWHASGRLRCTYSRPRCTSGRPWCTHSRPRGLLTVPPTAGQGPAQTGPGGPQHRACGGSNARGKGSRQWARVKPRDTATCCQRTSACRPFPSSPTGLSRQLRAWKDRARKHRA